MHLWKKILVEPGERYKSIHFYSEEEHPYPSWKENLLSWISLEEEIVITGLHVSTLGKDHILWDTEVDFNIGDRPFLSTIGSMLNPTVIFSRPAIVPVRQHFGVRLSWSKGIKETCEFLVGLSIQRKFNVQ